MLETDLLPPYSSKVKNIQNYTSTLQYIFMGWYLVKHGEDLTLSYHMSKEELNGRRHFRNNYAFEYVKE